jgi:hypothetical protein
VQRSGVDVVELVTTLPSCTHEARFFENVDVLRDGLPGRTSSVLRGEAGAELEQRLSVSIRKLVEDRSAGRIGERPEHITQ